MVSSKKVVFNVAVFVSIASLALAADAETPCVEVTFPNILGFGECLKEPQDLCHGNGNIMKVGMDIFNCAIDGITHLNFGSQLIIMEGLIKELFSNFGMGKLMDSIPSLCGTADGTDKASQQNGGNFLSGIFKPAVNVVRGAASPLIDCSGANTGTNVTCGSPVVFQFPSILNIGQCVNNSVSMCFGNEPNQGKILEEFFQTVTCVFSSITVKSPQRGSMKMVCGMLNSIQEMLRKGPFTPLADLITTMENVFGMKC